MLFSFTSKLKQRQVIGIFLMTVLTSATSFAGLPPSPFGVQVALQPGSSNQTVLVNFTLPTDCVIYSERLHFMTDGGSELVPSKIPEPVKEISKVDGKEKLVYDHQFSAELGLAALTNKLLVVKFQGCSNDSCFFPEKHTFALNASRQFTEVLPAPAADAANLESASADWTKEMHGFKVAAKQSGYLASTKFLSFLDRAISGQGGLDDPLGHFKNAGRTATLFLIVLGGFLLNLTPCILPMIPINLAIIGAGGAASSRGVGFRNGAVYGAGMALAYGALGVVVVLTGSKFGTLNSSISFNLVVAAVFAVLALGMFDVVNIDLSRFSGSFGTRSGASGKGTFVQNIVIFIMGIMAALLAGACVAPVVISVMLLAANIYSIGNVAGLLLPFLLGAGMALPWPFAGAGLTFLPKPGKWMKRVKHGFGILIIGFSLYYAYTGWEIFQGRRELANSTVPGTPPSAQGNANQELAEALRQARDAGRPVLVDFHASWCKNCLAMDETVFKKADVKKRFEDFVVVRYDAERPGVSPAREVLDHFGVIGLPTYIVLTETK